LFSRGLTSVSLPSSFHLDNYNNKSNDTEMLNFTIAHDETAIIPFILDAQKTAIAAGRTLRFLSSPWSPPGWMKSNRRMSCFPVGPLDCALLPEFQPAWALYFSRYLSAYAEAGVDIWGITVQARIVWNTTRARVCTATHSFSPSAERARASNKHSDIRGSIRACCLTDDLISRVPTTCVPPSLHA
jgi:O-glycosyl hydrolase